MSNEKLSNEAQNPALNKGAVINSAFFWHGINKIHLYFPDTYKLACGSSIQAGGYSDDYNFTNVTCKKCRKYISKHCL